MRTIRSRMLAGAAAIAVCFTVTADTPAEFSNATAVDAKTELPQVYNPADGAESRTIQPNTVNFTEMGVRLLGALLLVVGLFLAGAYIFKRTRFFNAVSAHEANLKIVESKSLGARHSLHVVKYGEQRFLISDTPNGTEFLTGLDTPPASLEVNDTPAQGSFANQLQQAVEGPAREQASLRTFVARLKNLFARRTS